MALDCCEPVKDYKTQLELLKEDKHNMEIKIGELEVDNNRFKVEIDELRVARNQVKAPSQTFCIKNETFSRIGGGTLD